MDYSIKTLPLDKLPSDCLVLGIYENRQPCSSALPSELQTLLDKALAENNFNGKNAESLMLNLFVNDKFTKLLLVGAGAAGKVSRKLYRKTLTTAANCIKENKLSSVTCCLADISVTEADTGWKVRQILEVFNDALYLYQHTKKSDTDIVELQHLDIAVEAEQQEQAQLGLQQGMAIAQGMQRCKLLGDLPGNICTPTYLAEQAQEIAQQHDNMTIEILEETDMEALGMGSFLAVSRGSRQPAKLICLHYKATDDDSKPIVLIGKGLTFDAGGISLKPGAGMDEMKYDMCGGATVLGVLQAAAQLQLPLNIVGLVPSSENLPDGNANKPGDVLTSMSGQTIEVLNTDAEGRLILCDTLTYAEKFNPDVVIDMATLTGACLVALGRVPSGLLGNDDTLCDALINAGEKSCDSVWRLPLWDEYQEQLKSNFADMANIGGKDAGTITAACFLSRFAEDYQWAHLDIAGTAWRSAQNKGATGRPIPLLMQYLLDRVDG